MPSPRTGPTATDRGQTSVDYAVDTAYDGGAGRADRFVVEALHPGHRAQAGLPVRLPPDRHQGRYDRRPVHQLPRRVRRRRSRSATPTGTRAGLFRSTSAPPRRSTRSTSTSRCTSACATWSRPRSAWACTGPTASRCSATGRQPDYPPTTWPSFTLGSVNVSPMTMAAAYATVADRGVYCRPIAIKKITDLSGHNLPDRVGRLPPGDAARGSPTRPTTSCAACSTGGTAAGRRHRTSGRREDRYRQRRLLRRLRRLHADPGRLRVGLQPAEPDRPPARCSATGQTSGSTRAGTWAGPVRCSVTTRRARPGNTPSLHADLGRALDFVAPPAYYFALGDGSSPPPPPKPKKPGGGGGKAAVAATAAAAADGGGGGNGH